MIFDFDSKEVVRPLINEKSIKRKESPYMLNQKEIEKLRKLFYENHYILAEITIIMNI